MEFESTKFFLFSLDIVHGSGSKGWSIYGETFEGKFPYNFIMMIQPIERMNYYKILVLKFFLASLVPLSGR